MSWRRVQGGRGEDGGEVCEKGKGLEGGGEGGDGCENV